MQIHPDLHPEPDLDPHQFADDKPKCMEYEPIWALFQEFGAPIFQKNRHQENVLRGGGHVHQEAAGEDD